MFELVGVNQMSQSFNDRQFNYNEQDLSAGPVIWWLQRDQRLADNWTFITASAEARRRNQPLIAVFCLQASFLDAQPAAYDFMLHGLSELSEDLAANCIPFLILGKHNSSDQDAIKQLAALTIKIRAGAIFTDFNPLRLTLTWKQEISAIIKCPLIEIDAHNIVPCRIASDKQEYAARTFRPKITRQLDYWLHEFPEKSDPSAVQLDLFNRIKQQSEITQKINSEDYQFDYLEYLRLNYNYTVRYLDSIVSKRVSDHLPLPGCSVAISKMNEYIEHKLEYYPGRNDPNVPAVSGLSPYLHFGQISAQRIALEVRKKANSNPELKSAASEFLEELIVRRELSDNFCFYNHEYDSFSGFPAWAQKTLREHEKDLRPYIYTYEQLEYGETHDELWNAAQLNLVGTGSMPGYLRMYWAKKILEWTVSPEVALSITIKLNDHYMLDGRDPNGYTGIAWSIGGVHDRPWIDRPVFGKIRLMTLSGCRRKFDVDTWIKSHS